MNDTVRYEVKVYGIDAADRFAYRTLRQGMSREEANVVTTLAVVSGAANEDAYVVVRADGVEVEDQAQANDIALALSLNYLAEMGAEGSFDLVIRSQAAVLAALLDS